MALRAHPLVFDPRQVDVEDQLVRLKRLPELRILQPDPQLPQRGSVVCHLQHGVRQQTAVQGQRLHLCLHLVRLPVHKLGKEVEHLLRKLAVESLPHLRLGHQLGECESGLEVSVLAHRCRELLGVGQLLQEDGDALPGPGRSALLVVVVGFDLLDVLARLQGAGQNALLLGLEKIDSADLPKVHPDRVVDHLDVAHLSFPGGGVGGLGFGGPPPRGADPGLLQLRRDAFGPVSVE